MFKNNINTSYKTKSSKLQLDDLPYKTMKVSIFSIKWIFIGIFLSLTFVILFLFLSNGNSYIQIIFGYTIAGFFTFFMGYFGWILAQVIIESVNRRKARIEHGIMYYFKKTKNKQ